MRRPITIRNDRAGAALAIVATLLLLACGSSKPATKTDGAGGAGALQATQAKTGGEVGKQVPKEELKQRVVEKIEEPTYLDGISEEAQDIFREGVRAVTTAKPDYAAAAKFFEDAIEADTGFLEAYFNLGMCYERLFKQERALEVYQSALDKNPDNVAINAYIAKIYLGKAREARLKGDAVKQEEWMTKAKGLLDQIIGLAPDDEAVNNAMALYYLAQDDLDTSERYVKEVLYVDPTNVTGLNTRGLINLKRGKYLLAEWIFLNKVLKIDEASTEALTNLGYTYIILDKRPLAMKYFRQALDLDPNNMDVRMNIAAMLQEHLNYVEAHEHYEKILVAEPLNLEAHEGRCDSLYGLGGAGDAKARFGTAIECYLEFVEKVPSRTELYKRIAETYQQKLQDFETAVKYYEIYRQRAKLAPEEDQKIAGTIKVLNDIVASGGMMLPEPEPEPEPETAPDGSIEGDPATDGAATPSESGDMPATEEGGTDEAPDGTAPAGDGAAPAAAPTEPAPATTAPESAPAPAEPAPAAPTPAEPEEAAAPSEPEKATPAAPDPNDVQANLAAKGALIEKCFAPIVAKASATSEFVVKVEMNSKGAIVKILVEGAASETLRKNTAWCMRQGIADYSLGVPPSATTVKHSHTVNPAP